MDFSSCDKYRNTPNKHPWEFVILIASKRTFSPFSFLRNENRTNFGWDRAKIVQKRPIVGYGLLGRGINLVFYGTPIDVFCNTCPQTGSCSHVIQSWIHTLEFHYFFFMSALCNLLDVTFNKKLPFYWEKKQNPCWFLLLDRLKGWAPSPPDLKVYPGDFVLMGHLLSVSSIVHISF